MSPLLSSPLCQPCLLLSSPLPCASHVSSPLLSPVPAMSSPLLPRLSPVPAMSPLLPRLSPVPAMSPLLSSPLCQPCLSSPLLSPPCLLSSPLFSSPLCQACLLSRWKTDFTLSPPPPRPPNKTSSSCPRWGLKAALSIHGRLRLVLSPVSPVRLSVPWARLPPCCRSAGGPSSRLSCPVFRRAAFIGLDPAVGPAYSFRTPSTRHPCQTSSRSIVYSRGSRRAGEFTLRPSPRPLSRSL
ncbi:hypothetical protein COCON_G00132550 [Conger conger]|uniref:Uncharacterized protein n=1 Tax=Conger conger TaxID=82655 RepID=A0A9Q1DE75_CONCO|nr:hypothetical protein COCON_G00132550 [Conger conger]